MTDMDRPLPARIRKALDVAADGPGRIATTAHPDCVCGKPTGEMKPLPRWLDPVGQSAGESFPVYGTKADCPQHRPEGRNL